MINNIKNILIVDDDTATIFLNKWILKKLDFNGNIATASNGQEALDLLTASTTPLEPFLIILDINMPVMTGWEFLEQYQYLEHRLAIDVVILMISAPIEDKERLEKSPYSFVNDCLQKPLRKKSLMAILDTHF